MQNFVFYIQKIVKIVGIANFVFPFGQYLGWYAIQLYIFAEEHLFERSRTILILLENLAYFILFLFPM